MWSFLLIMEKGSEINLYIDSWAFEGKGVARSDGKVIFIDGAVPGDTVKCVITRTKKSYCNAKVLEVLEASSDRITPKCKYFGLCGGCKMQNVAYDAQLRFKYHNVVDIFERIGGFKDLEIAPVIGSENHYFYRNKMEFTFSNRHWLFEEEIEENFTDKPVGVGLHIPKRYDKILNIEECWLQSELSSAILNDVRIFAIQNKLDAYSTKTHTGYLRHLVIRTSTGTNELMVNLVTTYDNPEIMGRFTEYLLERNPSISTIINNFTQRKSLVAFGEVEKIYHGSGSIIEKIGKYKFKISANSFFQTNTKQTERLYEIIKKFAGLKGKETVYDLYSGTGSIAIYLSEDSREVFGIEVIESAVSDAYVNTELNNIDNCKFLTGDIKEKLTKDTTWRNGLILPDVIILDPPRSGTHPKVITELIKMKPKSIVYVSCNPATQASDLKQLVEGGYKIVTIQPIDMFPQTYHIETVVLLNLV